jgi:hypothetical protein
MKKAKRTKKERKGQPVETDAAVDKINVSCNLVHRRLEKPAGFSHSSHSSAAVNLTNQNRTFHLLQKPDISYLLPTRVSGCRGVCENSMRINSACGP